MRHARRTTLTTSDIDQALRVLNIEPLYGHFPHNPPNFRRALPFPQLPTAGTVYFVEDEEIDFDRVLREEKLTLPKGVSWTAHWLAVEGVQPLIPENPPAIPKENNVDVDMVNGKSPGRQNGMFPPTPPSDRPQAKKQQQQQQLVKQVLSRELQLYYSRLTNALLPTGTLDEAKRVAALASLRNDAGLQALLPYLVRWVGEGVVNALKGGVQNESEARTLGVLLDVISAVLDNHTLFVEPYVSPLLPYPPEPPPPNTPSTAASPTPPTRPLNPPALRPPPTSSHPPPHDRLSNPLPSPHAALHDLPLPLPAHHENPPPCAHLPREKQRHARRRDPGSHGRGQRSDPQRPGGGRRREGRRRGVGTRGGGLSRGFRHGKPPFSRKAAKIDFVSLGCVRSGAPTVHGGRAAGSDQRRRRRGDHAAAWDAGRFLRGEARLGRSVGAGCACWSTRRVARDYLSVILDVLSSLEVCSSSPRTHITGFQL